jgi:acetyl-CoA acyltransferase
MLVSNGGCVRETSMEKLADLKPAKVDMTAGTSHPMTDGATAVLVCSESYLAQRGLTPLASDVRSNMDMINR